MPSTSLKAARERSGYSQQEVADWMQVSVVTVSRWENGHTQPLPYLLPKLCNLLERDLRELFPDQRREKPIPSSNASKGGVVAVVPHKIRSERLRLGLSQQALADQLQVSRVTVSRWEKGHDVPTRYHLRSLCRLFKRRPEELLPTKTPAHLPTTPLQPDAREKAQEMELVTLREQLARTAAELATLQEERASIQNISSFQEKIHAIVSLPQTLRRAREEQRRSQEQLAEDLEVDRRTYQRWEAGRHYPNRRHQLLLVGNLGLSQETDIKGH